MTKAKKRPSKAAKNAEKLLSSSKLLNASKVAKDAAAGEEFRSSVVTPRNTTSTANKPRPHKKRG